MSHVLDFGRSLLGPILLLVLPGCPRPTEVPPSAGSLRGSSADPTACEALELQVIGLRSLLPAPPTELRQPATTDIVEGAWRSGLNPAMQGPGVQPGLLEERIAFHADGRVCGVDRVVAPSGGYHAFEGRWALAEGVLMETYAEGRAPLSAGGASERRRVVIDAQRGTLQLEGVWPQRFERVAGARAGALGRIEGRELRVAGLLAGCFDSAGR